jgi:hypothetical protein
MGQPNVTVTFTRRETLVALDLPLTFTAEGGALKLSSFSRRYPARLEQLFWYALNLLKRASKDPYFRINDAGDYSTIPGYDGFVVTQQNLSPAATLGQRRDLVLVTIADPGSKVGKSVWFFQFLLQARPPVLDRIDEVNLGAAPSADVAIAALAPDGDEVTANMAKYDDVLSSWGTPSPLQLVLAADERTLRGTATLAAGTYNASVTSLSSSLADWQLFTVS